MGVRATILNMASAAQAGAGNTNALPGIAPSGYPFIGGLSVGAQDTLLIMVNLTVGVGITFSIDTLGPDGIWYTAIATSGALTAAAQWKVTLAGQNSASQEFGNYVRLVWSGACTFSAVIIGK